MGDDWVDVGVRDGKEHAKKAFEAELARGAKENQAKRANGQFQGETQREATKADSVRGQEEPKEHLIKLKPFVWEDPALIPPGRFIYSHHYVREYVSATLAPGAVGKSSLSAVEALCIATNKALLGVIPNEQCNVFIWNGEASIFAK